jgi:RNA polymerase sigma-B factor
VSPGESLHLTGLEQVEVLLESACDCAIGTDDVAAKQEAALLALDLADTIARRFAGRGIELDDLRQVARVGLLKAVRGYVPGRGRSFAAYAIPTITGEVKRHFRDCGWAVRPPRRLQEMRADLAVEEDRLRQELGREPSVEELAVTLGVSVTEVVEARECCAAYRAASLEASTSAGATVADRLPCEVDEYAVLETRAALGQAVASLSARERRILVLRYVEDRTQAEIGALLGVSQMQVSRLLASILRRLRGELLGEDRAA